MKSVIISTSWRDRIYASKTNRIEYNFNFLVYLTETSPQRSLLNHQNNKLRLYLGFFFKYQNRKKIYKLQIPRQVVWSKKPVARYCPFKIPTWSCECPLLRVLTATDLCSVSHRISQGLKPEKREKVKLILFSQPNKILRLLQRRLSVTTTEL